MCNSLSIIVKGMELQYLIKFSMRRQIVPVQLERHVHGPMSIPNDLLVQGGLVLGAK